MKLFVAALALAAVSIPATAQTVQSAEGDWSSLPRMKFSSRAMLDSDIIDGVQGLVKSGECRLNGVSKRHVDMSVPFLIRFSASGAVEEVVVRKLGCPKAESLLGGAIVEMAKAGSFTPTGQNTTGWYRSELSFSSSS